MKKKPTSLVLVLAICWVAAIVIYAPANGAAPGDSPAPPTTPGPVPAQLPEEDSYLHLPLLFKAPPAPKPVPAAVIANGGFEEGHVGWAEYSAWGYDLILPHDQLPVPPHTGSWAAWLGGEYDETSLVEQTITIPATVTTLHYWLWIASEEVCSVEYDIAGVLVNEEAVDAYLLCNGNDTGGWIPRSVDLSAYAGQQVLLTFAAFTDGALNSNLFLDTVQMMAQASSSPPILYPHITTGADTRVAESVESSSRTSGVSLPSGTRTRLVEWLEQHPAAE